MSNLESTKTTTWRRAATRRASLPGRPAPAGPYPCETRLKDGTPIRLRLVTPADKHELESGLERLSPASRYKRFMGAMKRLSPELLRYFTEIDYVNHFAVGALALDQEPPLGIGVARYVRYTGQPDMAEPAFAVVDRYQGRGLGQLLLRQLMREARRHGITRFRATLLADNMPMKALFARQGAHFTHAGDGVLVAEFTLDDAFGRPPGQRDPASRQ